MNTIEKSRRDAIKAGLGLGVAGLAVGATSSVHGAVITSDIDDDRVANVLNYDELRQTHHNWLTNYDVVYVRGALTAEGGGGGLFYFDENNKEDDDYGTIIKPSSVGIQGRWLRADVTTLTPEMFGAVGDYELKTSLDPPQTPTNDFVAFSRMHKAGRRLVQDAGKDPRYVKFLMTKQYWIDLHQQSIPSEGDQHCVFVYDFSCEVVSTSNAGLIFNKVDDLYVIQVGALLNKPHIKWAANIWSAQNNNTSTCKHGILFADMDQGDFEVGHFSVKGFNNGEISPNDPIHDNPTMLSTGCTLVNMQDIEFSCDVEGNGIGFAALSRENFRRAVKESNMLGPSCVNTNSKYHVVAINNRHSISIDGDKTDNIQLSGLAKQTVAANVENIAKPEDYEKFVDFKGCSGVYQIENLLIEADGPGDYLVADDLTTGTFTLTNVRMNNTAGIAVGSQYTSGMKVQHGRWVIFNTSQIIGAIELHGKALGILDEYPGLGRPEMFGDARVVSLLDQIMPTNLPLDISIDDQISSVEREYMLRHTDLTNSDTVTFLSVGSDSTEAISKGAFGTFFFYDSDPDPDPNVNGLERVSIVDFWCDATGITDSPQTVRSEITDRQGTPDPNTGSVLWSGGTNFEINFSIDTNGTPHDLVKGEVTYKGGGTGHFEVFINEFTN